MTAASSAQPVSAEPEPTIEWRSLGSNQRGILVAVNYENITNLPDPQLEFLMQLLKACQLSLNDVALININNYPYFRSIQYKGGFAFWNNSSGLGIPLSNTALPGAILLGLHHNACSSFA